MRRSLLALITVTLLASRARANGPEDLFGMSARTTAMGGAAVAVSNDGFAAYHNPAGLSRCADHQMSMETRNTIYGLRTTRVGADAPGEPMRPMSNPIRVNVATCLRLPAHFAVGMALGLGLQDPASLSLDTSSNQPNFPLYGDSLEYLNINVGASYRPIPQLAIGGGASILVNTHLTLSAFVPVGQLDANGNYANLAFNIGLKVNPTATPYIGVLIEPHRRIRVGMTFRGQLTHHLDLPMSITAVFLDWTVPIPMRLSVDSWFSPRSLSIGGAFEATDAITVSAEATWYNYAALADSTYPYLKVRELPGATGSVLGLVGLPNPDAPGYRNVWALRAGIEGRLLEGRLAIRGGYALRTSALPDPGMRNTTLLDGTMHSFTGGAGYAFGRRWDEIEARHPAGTEAEARAARHRRVLRARAIARARQRGEPVLESDVEAATAAEIEEDEDEAEERGEQEAIEFSARVDLFGRLSVMPNQTSATKDIRYGGTILDMGLQFTLGFR